MSRVGEHTRIPLVVRPHLSGPRGSLASPRGQFYSQPHDTVWLKCTSRPDDGGRNAHDSGFQWGGTQAVRTRLSYPHVLDRGPLAVRSPADRPAILHSPAPPPPAGTQTVEAGCRRPQPIPE